MLDHLGFYTARDLRETGAFYSAMLLGIELHTLDRLNAPMDEERMFRSSLLR